MFCVENAIRATDPFALALTFRFLLVSDDREEVAEQDRIREELLMAIARREQDDIEALIFILAEVV